MTSENCPGKPSRAGRPAIALALALAASVGFLVGCGGAGHSSTGASTRPVRPAPSSGPTHGAPASRTTASQAPAGRAPGSPRSASGAGTGTTVKVVNTQYGRMLVGGRSHALYLFTRESGTSPRCYGACATRWPPFVVGGPPGGAPGTRSTLLGVTRRQDGRLQATYAGHPLYYYFGDRAPRQVLCQGVDEFGGHWYVVAPSGAAIH